MCWWDTGHMLVAQIAQITLQNEDPNALKVGTDLAGILNGASHGKINSFVEAACWPDDVKKYGLHNIDDWHFIDVPVWLPKKDNETNLAITVNDAMGYLVILNFNKFLYIVFHLFLNFDFIFVLCFLKSKKKFSSCFCFFLLFFNFFILLF
jgi:hypothetical protein